MSRLVLSLIDWLGSHDTICPLEFVPVIVGIDLTPGSSNPGTDSTTDHFVVIVGMGSDSNGNYFTFYDNASGGWVQGTSPNNKLYYNSTVGILQGTTDASSYSEGRAYRVTQIRKSKLL